MGKKIMGILVFGLVVALVVPVGCSYANYDAKLSAVGFVRIDPNNSEIKGFVLFGINDGHGLRFTFIKIKYDDRRTPLDVDGALPFLMHTIYYNPAE